MYNISPAAFFVTLLVGSNAECLAQRYDPAIVGVYADLGIRADGVGGMQLEINWQPARYTARVLCPMGGKTPANPIEITDTVEGPAMITQVDGAYKVTFKGCHKDGAMVHGILDASTREIPVQYDGESISFRLKWRPCAWRPGQTP